MLSAYHSRTKMKPLTLLLLLPILIGCSRNDRKPVVTASEQATIPSPVDRSKPALLNFGTVAILCQDGVKSKLSSPATAQFPSLSESQPKETPTGWLFTSYVDAENQMGATVRRYYTCELTSKDETITSDQLKVTMK